MSRFITAALGAAVVLGMAGVAGAQAPARTDSAKWARHGQMAGERGERGKFMKDLNLSDAQKNQIKAIHKKYEPQMKQIREQGKAEFGDMRAARQKGDTSAATRAKFQQFRERTMTVRQQENNEIHGILTADQRTRWDAAQAQRKQRMEAHEKGTGRHGQAGKAGKA
jgi:periplasmic protein CpxP/Spy